MFINVEFEPEGKRYCYRTPFDLEVGQFVLVKVFQNVSCAKVVATNVEPPKMNIKSIYGVGYRLEELEAAPVEESSYEQPSLLETILGVRF